MAAAVAIKAPFLFMCVDSTAFHMVSVSSYTAGSYCAVQMLAWLLWHTQKPLLLTLKNRSQWIGRNWHGGRRFNVYWGKKKQARVVTCCRYLICTVHDLRTQLTLASSGLESDSCLIVSQKATHHIWAASNGCLWIYASNLVCEMESFEDLSYHLLSDLHWVSTSSNYS